MIKLKVNALTAGRPHRYGLAEEGFIRRKKKQLLVEQGQNEDQSTAYVDPLRALEAMGARDIKVGLSLARGMNTQGREAESVALR